MLQRRLLRQGDLFIVVYHPLAIALDVGHIVSTPRVLADMGDPVDCKRRKSNSNELADLRKSSHNNNDKPTVDNTYIPTMLYFPSPSSSGTLGPEESAAASSFLVSKEAIAPSKSSMCENNQSAARSAAPLVSFRAART